MENETYKFAPKKMLSDHGQQIRILDELQTIAYF